MMMMSKWYQDSPFWASNPLMQTTILRTLLQMSLSYMMIKWSQRELVFGGVYEGSKKNDEASQNLGVWGAFGGPWWVRGGGAF